MFFLLCMGMLCFWRNSIDQHYLLLAFDTIFYHIHKNDPQTQKMSIIIHSGVASVSGIIALLGHLNLNSVKKKKQTCYLLSSRRKRCGAFCKKSLMTQVIKALRFRPCHFCPWRQASPQLPHGRSVTPVKNVTSTNSLSA